MNMDREAILSLLKAELPYLYEQYGVKRLALFGSYAQTRAHRSSDIDLLVQLERPLGFQFFHLAEYLEAKLGKKVDLITFESLERGAANPRRAHIAENINHTLVYV